MPLPLPKAWTISELQRDAATAKAKFRIERLAEPRDDYVRFYELLVPVFSELIGKLSRFADDAVSSAELAEILPSKAHLVALRYLAAPPISSDDLSTITDLKITDATHRRPVDLAIVRSTILQILDPFRFPWIVDHRPATLAEIDAAVVSSAAMVAAQQVTTKRRSTATREQEAAVKRTLFDAGFIEVPSRVINHFGDAPAPNEFCGESMLGGTRADIIATLHDRRILAIECKSSNSAVNSFKRLIHEALGKAHKWSPKFGRAHVVPAAVLSGVFSPANLEAAQAGGLSLFWQFRMSDLADFVDEARASS